MSITNDHDGTILIVDDTPSNLSIVSSFLEKSGFKVLVAEDGKDTGQITLSAQPDLILLDALMPNPDGFETCLNLKADPNTKDIPVIFMTALSDPVNKVKGFNVGGVDYITKPFHQEEVLAKVKPILRFETFALS